MGVGRWWALGGLAMLTLACSVPNPAFDPPRNSDTEPLPTDDSGDGTTVVMPSDDGDESTSSDETGTNPELCLNEPQEHVGLRVFLEGNEVSRCGAITSRQCVLIRNDTMAQWELTECCLADDGCPGTPRYLLEFSPTGPALGMEEHELEVNIDLSYAPIDQGCKLEWVEINETNPPTPEVPPLIFMAASSPTANDVVSVQASPGGPLPGEVCECAEVDAACCPEDLGRHSLELHHEIATASLDPIAPTQTFPIDNSELALEMNLVRAWQPPKCDAAPEYEWIARRLWH